MKINRITAFERNAGKKVEKGNEVHGCMKEMRKGGKGVGRGVWGGRWGKGRRARDEEGGRGAWEWDRCM